MKTELIVTDDHPYKVEQKEAKILMKKALAPVLPEITGSDGYYRPDLKMGNVPESNWNGTINLLGWDLMVQENSIVLSMKVSHVPYEPLIKKAIEYTFERYREIERDYLKTVEQLEIMKQAGREIPNIIS